MRGRTAWAIYCKVSVKKKRGRNTHSSCLIRGITQCVVILPGHLFVRADGSYLRGFGRRASEVRENTVHTKYSQPTVMQHDGWLAKPYCSYYAVLHEMQWR